MDRDEFVRLYLIAKAKDNINGICIHLQGEGRLWVTQVHIGDPLLHLYDGNRYVGVINLSIVESVDVA